MPFQVAGAAEVIRATQKDESFLDYFKSCISEIVQLTVGKTYLHVYIFFVRKSKNNDKCIT